MKQIFCQPLSDTFAVDPLHHLASQNYPCTLRALW